MRIALDTRRNTFKSHTEINEGCSLTCRAFILMKKSKLEEYKTDLFIVFSRSRS